MRTLIAIALVATFGVATVQAAENAQVAQTQAAASATPVTKKEVRDIARNFLTENKVRQGRVGDIRTVDGGYEVELKSADGIRLKTLKIDAAGQIVN